MKHVSIALAATLAALGTPALAQVSAPIPSIAAGHTLLTVTAEGSSTQQPDMALFNAGVTTQGDTASAALAENSRKMTEVIAALKRAGIADRDIQTSNLNLNPVYAQPRRLPDGSFGEQEQRIIGYQVTNNVLVKQRKLTDYGKVIDALVSAGANQVNGPNFMLATPDSALNEARAEAIKVARQRAQLYATAAGLRVSGITSISEAGGYATQPVSYREIKVTGQRADAPPPPIMGGELETNAAVTVQFELAP